MSDPNIAKSATEPMIEGVQNSLGMIFGGLTNFIQILEWFPFVLAFILIFYAVIFFYINFFR